MAFVPLASRLTIPLLIPTFGMLRDGLMDFLSQGWLMHPLSVDANNLVQGSSNLTHASLCIDEFFVEPFRGDSVDGGAD